MLSLLFPSPRADSLREINEAERSGWGVGGGKGPRNQNSLLRFQIISLSGLSTATHGT